MRIDHISLYKQTSLRGIFTEAYFITKIVRQATLYRAAKTLLSHRVCFGCFVFYAVIEYHCRSPPGRLDLSIFNSNRKEQKGNEKIILRTQYPWYKGDEYIEVSDEIADFIESFVKIENNYTRKQR